MSRRHAGIGLLGLAYPLFAVAGPSGLVIYFQRTGKLHWATSVTVDPIATGYSGAGEHRNNPNSQCTSELGPIPVGAYAIGKLQDIKLPDGHIIKDALPLKPDASSKMCGRSGFLIHGDSKQFKGWASGGCIILRKEDRLQLVKLGAKRLEVRSG